MVICGIDEAGRGPVMGPMVMAGFFIPDDVEGELSSLGLRDSKLLSPKRREFLYEKLRKVGDVKFEITMPFKLNELMNSKTLNEIEFDAAVAILTKVHTTIGNNNSNNTNSPINSGIPFFAIYIDAFAPAAKLGAQMKEALPFQATIVAEHKADDRYPIVSAASIMAKVTRDRIIGRLKEEVGDFGSGYPADPKTIAFLRKWLSEQSSTPPYVRTHWKTYTRLVRERTTRKLDEFF